jgi:hypothetical protein
MQAYRLTNAEKVSYTLKSKSTMLFSSALEQPFTEVTDVPMVMPEQSGWLLCDAGIAEEMIVISPFSLQRETEPVIVGDTPLPFDFEHTGDGPACLKSNPPGQNWGR